MLVGVARHAAPVRDSVSHIFGAARRIWSAVGLTDWSVRASNGAVALGLRARSVLCTVTCAPLLDAPDLAACAIGALLGAGLWDAGLPAAMLDGQGWDGGTCFTRARWVYNSS